MNVFLKAVKPANAPKALGPYSPAVKLGDFVYLSGQIPLNPETGEMCIRDRLQRMRNNISQHTLRSFGTTVSGVRIFSF